MPVYIDWQTGFVDYQIVERSEFPYLCILTDNWISGLSDDRDLRIPMLTDKLDLWNVRKKSMLDCRRNFHLRP